MAGYVAPVQTVAAITPGFGSASMGAFQALNQTQAAVSTTTVNIPSSGVLTFNGANVTLSRGWIRARFSGTVATLSTMALTVQGKDGTNTVNLFTSPATGAIAATVGEVEYIFPFLSERLFNLFTFLCTLTGAAGTMQADYEVCGTA